MAKMPKKKNTKGKRKHRLQLRKAALCTAMAMAMANMIFVPAASANGVGGSATISDERALTVFWVLTGTEQLTVTNSGALTIEEVFPVVIVAPQATGVTIDNSGQIIGGAGQGGVLVEAGALNTTIINQIGGLISGPSHAGIEYETNLHGLLSNSGEISTVASSTSSSTTATVYGVYIDNDLSGILNNSGTISAEASGSSSASAFGVYIDNDLSGTLSNSGSITASATAASSSASASASADGIRINGSVVGVLSNSGTISATADAATSADAYGIRINDCIAGTLSNSGTINASTVTEGDSGEPNFSDSAYGIRINGWERNPIQEDGVLENSGTISGTTDLPENGYSLYIADGGEGGGYGTVNNLENGLLSGNIYIGSGVLVNNSGTIFIPSMPFERDGDEVIGGHLAGNYNQTAGGILQIGAKSTTDYGTLTVDGTAEFAPDARIDVNVAPTNDLQKGDILTAVFKAPNLAANTSFIVTDNWQAYDFNYILKLVDDGYDSVDLEVVDAARLSVRKQITGRVTPAALGAADIFDTLNANNGGTAEMQKILNDLKGATDQELANIVNQTTPMLNTELSACATRNQQHTKRLILARQESNRDDNSGLNSGDTFFGDRNFWLTPFGSWSEQDDVDGIFGYDANAYGLIIGADGKSASAKYGFGAALAYSRTDIDSNNTIARQTAEVKSYQGIVYGNYNLDDITNWTWQADIALHNNTTYRALPFWGVAATGDYDGWSTHLGTGIDRRYEIAPNTSLLPGVRLDYSYLSDESYSETGAGALNLSINSQNTDELIFALEAKLTHNLSADKMLIADLGVGYDVLDDNTSAASAFAGAPGLTFQTLGIDASPWLTNAGLGIVFGSLDTVLVTARYDMKGREDYLNQSVSFRLKKSF